MIIFKAKTSEAYCIKILAELLANNLKSGCFEIDENGITLVMMDHYRKILINLVLHSINFPVFKFNHTEKMYLGINLNHLHRLTKSIKKKDQLELSITSDAPTDLNITLPTGYDKPIIIPSGEYSKMLKDLGSLGNNIKGNVIKISSKNRQIEFACDSAGILKRKVKFGEADDSLSEELIEALEEYSEEFSSDLLCRITKLAGLSNQIQVYIGKPLLLCSNVGNLGKIQIYIKSKNEISRTIENEENDDEDEDET